MTRREGSCKIVLNKNKQHGGGCALFYLNSERNPSESRNPQKRIRDINRKQLFGLIHSGRASSRAEMVGISGLSPSAVSSLTEELLAERLLMEVGPDPEHRGDGRKPILLRPNPLGAQFAVFTIDSLGVNYTLFNLNCEPIEHIFRPCIHTPLAGRDDGRGRAYVTILREILEGQSTRLIPEKLPALLLSFPGVWLRDEDILLLTGVGTTIPLDSLRALEADFSIPIFVGNTSVALAYAQKKALEHAGKPADDLIYINICSGVGSGIIRDGQPICKSGEISGEIGHITIELNGRACSCGNRGCLEQYVSVQAIIDEVRLAVAADRSGRYSAELRDILADTTLARIGQAYAEGIEPVCAALNLIAHRLSAGIGSIVNVTGIRHVVIGGIRLLGDAFLQRVQELLTDGGRRFLMKHVELAYDTLSDDAEGLGILYYYIDNVFMNG